MLILKTFLRCVNEDKYRSFMKSCFLLRVREFVSIIFVLLFQIYVNGGLTTKAHDSA